MESFTAQIKTTTSFDRYPNVFKTVKNLFRLKDNRELRILSFGCSEGEEVACLAEKYFPSAQVIGLDVNEDVLAIAERKNSIEGFTTYELSNPESLKRHGPYDIIFAMAVLCRWPETKALTEISNVFSFRQYESLVSNLNDHLKVGGALVVNGANYQFLDADVSEMYAIVLDSDIGNNGAVKRFDKFGNSCTGHFGTDTIFTKILSAKPETNGAFRNFRITNANGDFLGTLTTTRAPSQD